MSWNPFCQDFLNRYPNNIDYIWLGSPTYKSGSAGNERNVTLEEIKAQNRAGRYEGATLHGLQYKFLQGDDKISEYKAQGKVVVIYNAHDFTMAVFGKDEVETGEYCRRSLLEAKYSGLSMGMGFPRESHGKCPMGWDGMGQHELQFPWH